MNRVIHFEIGAENPDRAVDFYKKTFGWQIEKWRGPYDYWLVMTGEENEKGINGGIFKREEGFISSWSMSKAANFICTVDIKDIDECMMMIKQNGGDIIQDKSEIPEVGWLAYARDTEGNIFGIMQGMMVSEM